MNGIWKTTENNPLKTQPLTIIMPEINLLQYQQKAVDALAEATYKMLQNTDAPNKSKRIMQ